MNQAYQPRCGCTTRRQLLGWAALTTVGALTGVAGLAGCSQADNSAQSLAPVEIDRATSCELDGMLLRVADAYERAVDHKIEVLFKLLQPALLIVVAAFVGFIVVALFLPLMRIMSTLNQA